MRRAALSSISLFLLVAFVAVSPSVAASTYVSAVTATNVVDSSFTASWVTAEAVPGSGSVCYGTTATTLSCHVQESAGPGGSKGDVHSAFVSNLSPSTTYF